MLEDKYPDSKSRFKRRKLDWAKAIRKKHITEEMHLSCNEDGYYKNLHEYSKNKIHCSCPMCRAKTKNKGDRRKGSWAKPYNPSMAEIKSNQMMNDSLSDYFNEEE